MEAVPALAPHDTQLMPSADDGRTRRSARKPSGSRALMFAGAGLVLFGSVLVVFLASRSRSPDSRAAVRPPTSASGKASPKGALSGLVGPAGRHYDLTALGTADWVHWGRRGTELPKGQFHFDRMANGGNQISNVTLLGSAEVGMFWADTRSVSWSNGTPTASVQGETGFIWSAASVATSGPTGFQFTATADTTPRTLFILAGGFNVATKLTAHLSYGSAPDYTVSRPAVAGTGTYANLYTINYHAASAGQTLTITYVKIAEVDHHDSVDLIAAWLQQAPSPPASGKQPRP